MPFRLTSSRSRTSLACFGNSSPTASIHRGTVRLTCAAPGPARVLEERQGPFGALAVPVSALAPAPAGREANATLLSALAEDEAPPVEERALVSPVSSASVLPAGFVVMQNPVFQDLAHVGVDLGELHRGAHARLHFGDDGEIVVLQPVQGSHAVCEGDAGAVVDGLEGAARAGEQHQELVPSGHAEQLVNRANDAVRAEEEGCLVVPRRRRGSRHRGSSLGERPRVARHLGRERLGGLGANLRQDARQGPSHARVPESASVARAFSTKRSAH